MKREAPTEREIADLIASAYEGLAAPDPRHLAAIEERLHERPRRRAKIAWWLLAGGLFAGAASALWWAVNYDSAEGRNQPVPAVSAPSVAPPAVEPRRPEDVATKPAGEPDRKSGPVIYQLEQ